jgi:hypothetical protein
VRANVLSELGRQGDTLAEMDVVKAEYVEALGATHPFVLVARHLRAECLARLERWDDALEEINDIEQLEIDRLAPQRWISLVIRSLRIGIEIATHRNGDHEDELRDIANAMTAATSQSSQRTLWTRYRLGRLLFQRGRTKRSRAAVRKEIIDVIAHFDLLTSTSHTLLRSTNVLLALIDGHSVDENLEV